MTAIAEAVFVKSSNPWLNCLRSTTRGVCGRLAPPCAWHRLGGEQNAAVAAKKSAAVARKRRVQVRSQAIMMAHGGGSNHQSPIPLISTPPPLLRFSSTWFICRE